MDEKVFRKFKAESVRKRMKLGNALTNAMMTWLGKEREKREVKKHFLDLKLMKLYGIDKIMTFDMGFRDKGVEVVL